MILATTGAMLLLTCGIALAASTIVCQIDGACNGTPHNDTMKGTSGGDNMHGLVGKDGMKGNRGPDRMYGGLGQDRVYGDYGEDKLFGDNDNDTLDGGYMADRITGGLGNDTIDGGPGNDVVFADDGRRDSISCGPGTKDVAFVDAADVDAEGTDLEDFIRLTSCETINEPEALSAE